jgi:hypothetical protein
MLIEMAKSAYNMASKIATWSHEVARDQIAMRKGTYSQTGSIGLVIAILLKPSSEYEVSEVTRGGPLPTYIDSSLATGAPTSSKCL